MSLSGKVALVTGAAQGLGKAFSEALLKRGAKVCLTDVQSKKGEATASEFQQQFGQEKAVFVKCDVTSQSEMENVFASLKKRFGRLDIMVNNAGISNEHNPVLMTDINVMGVIRGTSMAIDLMNKLKGGHGGLIINVASTAGLTPKAYVAPAYTASKYAVAGYTQSWAYNPYLKEMGLSFACLCPAFTATAILNSISSLYPRDAEKFMAAIGINEISDVVKGFMQLVDDENCNGAVMAVLPNKGIVYHKKPLASRL